MHKQNYQDILSRVQMPTQYVGNEINTIRKDLKTVDLTFALVFPDLYEIGTSHFGLQILYSILNSHEKIAAERFFAPAPDMEALLSEKKIPCLSMESKKELKSFDIIGISLLYELNFTNILTLLSLSSIPFYSRDREGAFPLIIGGGPCAFNPEPLADFFDAFVIGDGEEVSMEIADLVMAFKKEGDGQKKTLLRLLSKIDGVYIPSFFTPVYDNLGLQRLTPLFEDYQTVRRVFLPSLTKESFPVAPIIPFAKPVHDRLRLEIARGCSRGCRFCQAGMIYRPVRERSLEDLIDITTTSLKTTGHSDISLLSLSTGDYSNLPELMKRLHAIGQEHCNAISLPSIRAEKLTPDLMQIIKKVRKTGFTIAPEAGSQRLRDIINKNLTEDSILSAVENAMNLGWKNIKLYFMLGLPFETQEDIEAICHLSRRLASSYAKGKKTINVSTTCFIPKAHTPFQRYPQISLSEAREKLQYLKSNLRHPKINLKWQGPEMSLLEGVWSRGDRRLSRLLVSAFEKGCRLDGWTDKFDFSLWQKAFEETGIDPLFYTSRQRDDDEPLPWDHIDSGISPGFLNKEFEKAKQGSLTPDCRDNDCTGCGICDFKTIRPVLYDGIFDSRETASLPPQDQKRLPEDAFTKFELSFSKLDEARFFGHLELGIIFQRAVKRAGLNTRYSQGFNPLMQISFENALPVGMESEEEILFIYFEKKMTLVNIVDLLNKELPKGLFITGCKHYHRLKNGNEKPARYSIRISEECFDKEEVERFLQLSEFVVQDLSKKGKTRTTDLRKSVEKISFINPHTIEMILKRYNERTVRPMEILTNCFKLDEKAMASARITKMRQG
ncbi:MAG: B12-binding domain-containing radical SAM protein [Desulfobacterales bacterium RIFOXYA12_FULL_46_15]|nr:MAG: B12-binding domain-containing radical SAM protein [Desulfobacterales bacterium RIFOXYA12_FULL_46_15]